MREGREPWIAALALTAPQKRHLDELLADDGISTRYWRPANSGEEACALALRRKGLLSGSFLTHSDSYYLNGTGLEVARILRDANSQDGAR